MKAFWYVNPKYPNLGDEIAHINLRRIYDIEPALSGFQNADIVSVGSVMGWIWQYEYPERLKEMHIVGSGFISAETSLKPLPFLNIHSVRGYLSKNKLGHLDSDLITVGDPGLLASLVAKVPHTTKKNARYGVVLHHRFSDDEELKRRFSHLPVEFIDIRTDDIDAFSSLLLSYDAILSQSLHGLIIADSFGIPNVWLRLEELHVGGDFKFLDYFSSVGRDCFTNIKGIPESILEIDSKLSVAPSHRVIEVQKDICRAYETALERIEKSTQRGVSMLDKPIQLEREAAIDLSKPESQIRVDYKISAAETVQYKDIMVVLNLVDEEGQSCTGKTKVAGFPWSSAPGVGHYQYLDVRPGTQAYSLFINLPKGIYCKSLKFKKWKNLAQSIEIKSLELAII